MEEDFEPAVLDLDVEEPEQGETEVIENINNFPARTDPAWGDWILTQLDDSEKDENNNPLCDGLRRLVNLHIGQILENSTHVYEAHENYCLVERKVVVNDGGVLVTYIEPGEVTSRNTVEPYILHPAATAATKAESRCLRKILGLRHVYTHEEMETAKAVDTTEFEPMQDVQLQHMDLMGKRLDINIKQLVANYKIDKRAKKIGFNEAADICEMLNNYHRKRDTIPEELLGYDKNWRDKNKS
jgi:hypothetical protein